MWEWQDLFVYYTEFLQWRDYLTWTHGKLTKFKEIPANDILPFWPNISSNYQVFPCKINILLVILERLFPWNTSEYTKFCLVFKPDRQLSNDYISHPSKQTPFSTSGISKMAVWPAATTCGDSFCDLDTCQQETENHMEHKTAAVCNDLILTYNKELGHMSLFVLHYKINDVDKSLEISPTFDMDWQVFNK